MKEKKQNSVNELIKQDRKTAQTYESLPVIM